MKSYLIISIFFLICSKTLANELSNQSIIGDIERHLLFNEETGKIKTNDATYNGDNTIFDEDEEEYEPKFDIIVVDANFNKKSKEKKKLAYNSNILGHYEVSIELYKDILAENESDTNALFGLAFSYQNLHQYSEAKELYYDLLRSGGNIDKDKIVNNLLSIIIEENPEEAIFFLTKLSAQHPDSGNLIAKSALTYEKINKTDKAIDLMKRALFLDPSNFQYQYNLAIMLDKKGDYQSAKAMYDRILLKLSRSDGDRLGISLDNIYERAKYLDESL